MVSGGVLVGHLFGMRLLEVNGPKTGTDQESNRALGVLVADIRSAKLLLIGNGTLASFSSVNRNTAQAGNAIQVYPSTDTNFFIRYFWDAGDLKRTSSGGPATSVAHSISNSLVFTAVDSVGNVLTNFQNNSLSESIFNLMTQQIQRNRKRIIPSRISLGPRNAQAA